MGLHWQSGGYNSMLSLLGAQVQSLVGKLRLYMLQGEAKKKKVKKKRKKE